MATVDYNRLLLHDWKKANEELHNESNNRIKFIWVLSSFKMNKLLRAILRLFNENDFYSAFSLIRTLTEISCFCNYTLNKAKPLIEELNKNTTDYIKYNEINNELEDALLLGMKSTRIKVVENEFADTVTAKNILNAIDYISKNKKYETMRAKYDILCDYVHPNMFSNSVFGVLTKMYKEEGKTFQEAKIATIRGEMDRYCLDLPEEYSVLIANYFGMLVSIIDMDIDLFRETVDEFKNVHTELLTAKMPNYDRIETLSEEQKKMLLDLLPSKKPKQN